MVIQKTKFDLALRDTQIYLLSVGRPSYPPGSDFLFFMFSVIPVFGWCKMLLEFRVFSHNPILHVFGVDFGRR